MPPDALTCPELTELVTDYLEESLPAPQRKRFEAHLRDCESCQDDLDSNASNVESFGKFARGIAPAGDKAQTASGVQKMESTTLAM